MRQASRSISEWKSRESERSQGRERRERREERSSGGERQEESGRAQNGGSCLLDRSESSLPLFCHFPPLVACSHWTAAWPYSIFGQVRHTVSCSFRSPFSPIFSDRSLPSRVRATKKFPISKSRNSFVFCFLSSSSSHSIDTNSSLSISKGFNFGPSERR